MSEQSNYKGSLPTRLPTESVLAEDAQKVGERSEWAQSWKGRLEWEFSAEWER